MRLQHNVCTPGKVDSYTFEGKNINYIMNVNCFFILLFFNFNCQEQLLREGNSSHSP